MIGSPEVMIHELPHHRIHSKVAEIEFVLGFPATRAKY
jgi:hypothetical protein